VSESTLLSLSQLDVHRDNTYSQEHWGVLVPKTHPALYLLFFKKFYMLFVALKELFATNLFAKNIGRRYLMRV